MAWSAKNQTHSDHNHFRRRAAVAAAAWILASEVAASSRAGFNDEVNGIADEENADAATNFNFGDSCDRLLDMEENQRLDLLQPRLRGQWLRFCRISSGQMCDDYSDLFFNYGALISANGRDPTSCSFEPYFDRENEYQDWPPNHSRHLGSRK